jgi:hypothetical protein
MLLELQQWELKHFQILDLLWRERLLQTSLEI